MKPVVSLLHLGIADPSDHHLSRLLERFGVEFREVSLSRSDGMPGFLLSAGDGESPVLLASGRTFSALIRRFGETVLHERISRNPACIFL